MKFLPKAQQLHNAMISLRER